MTNHEYENFIDNIGESNSNILDLANNLGCAFIYPEDVGYEYINEWLEEKGLLVLDTYIHNNIDFSTMEVNQLVYYMEVFYKHRFHILIHYFKTKEEIEARMKQFTNLDDFIANFDNPRCNLQISKKEPMWFEFVDTKQIKK